MFHPPPGGDSKPFISRPGKWHIFPSWHWRLPRGTQSVVAKSFRDHGAKPEATGIGPTGPGHMEYAWNGQKADTGGGGEQRHLAR